MNCEEVSRRLSEEIALSGSREMEEHLSECAECRKLMEDLRSIGRISTLLGELDQAPPEFSRLTGRRLRERAGWRRLRKPVLAGSLAAVIFLGVFLEVQDQNPPKPVPVSEGSGEVRSLPLRRTEREVQWVLSSPDGMVLEELWDDGRPGDRPDTGIPARIEVRTGNLHDDSYLNFASY